MSKFKIGDKVIMTGIPIEIEVSEVGTVCKIPNCEEEIFGFKDPVTGEDDWAHESDFTKVG